MKYLNKIAVACCAAALGMLTLTGCEGADTYGINSPDWLSEKIDSIAATQNQGEENIEGLQEDVYTVGATDYTTGWWAAFSKYYQIPDGQAWYAKFNLNINPSASNTYKNFVLILCNDEDRGTTNYKEYGAIRFDNQPSGNSEWGDYINRDLVQSNLTFGSDTDSGVEKLGGTVTLTVDRSRVDTFLVKITNGTVTKTYVQPSAMPNLNADASNTNIRAFLVPEGSFINFLQSTIEPIGGFTSAEDKQPLKMTLNGVPKKVLLGTSLEDAMKNITATVEFEQAVSKEVTFDDLQLQAIPDMNNLGTKTLIAVYNKTYKGENCPAPVIATAQFEVVDKMYTMVGLSDNSTPWWTAFSDDIKVGPKETFVTTFTNYTNGLANWNNFLVVLRKSSLAEYAVVRADNFGWGDCYASCTPVMDGGAERNWATWLAAMDGAKVTAYITNNGDGTADIKAVMQGNDGNTYTQEYNGFSGIDPNDFYFCFTVEGAHLEFDTVVGEEDNTTAWWTAHSENFTVPEGRTYTTRIKNYTNGTQNWNNFLVVLTRADNSEYAVLRSDNYGWGDSYVSCTPVMDGGAERNWTTWLAAMDDATVTVSVTNNGSSANVKCIMLGNDGNTYTQEYNGISPITASDFRFRFTIEGGHLVFE